MIKLPLNEIFESIQGEGSFTGAPSIFVRLQGCPVGCAWCDTKHSWYLNEEDKTSFEQVLAKTGDGDSWCDVEVDQLIAHLLTYKARHIVISGGEPCMYDLVLLTTELEANGFSCQIETSGTFDVKVSDSTHVTVSPKVAMKGGYEILDQALVRANEIKHPVAMSRHIDELDALLARLTPEQLAQKKIYLQPISQQKRATQLAIDTCIERNWWLSIQTHKYLAIQ
ncbi:7-carboxy-7-deazaguanine synthase QueE [Psychrobium sp. 1_MG-2023]|uniref:7-carboxy-7-deazaguanine synthase QueE n=1 Tax=Psychrobium sp. 1_MG-2023 TaxID=3062624 RepID=UPI002732FDFB|nr:7-carboxy-7-deazaguanine synthase QueE [Psychrobium sp. 1_MG-2023]MDP2562471.1 7-carboxy-7-deazaguanine synthase QueE [Psychrobium sp. 1_MG-2023]